MVTIKTLETPYLSSSIKERRYGQSKAITNLQLIEEKAIF